MANLTEAELQALRLLDTPTVCNALEVLVPQRRGSGYTVEPFVCPRPLSRPIVGYARTATIRSMQPSTRSPDAAQALRLEYYEHISSGPQPTVTVIQDLDPIPGYGAWWGEVNTNLHRGLGSLGVVTNGSVRDIEDSAEGFGLLAGRVGPSHAWVRVEEIAVTVHVHGMTVGPGDLVHADRHGAVVIPHDVAASIPEAAAEIASREHVLIRASNEQGFDINRLRELFG